MVNSELELIERYKVGSRVTENNSGKRGTVSGYSYGWIRIIFDEANIRKSFRFPEAFLKGKLY